MATLNEQLRRGMRAQLNDSFAEAESIYRKVLSEHPDNPDACHLLGLVRAELDHEDEGIVLIEKAISARPDVAAFHHNIAGVYRRMGHHDAAEAAFRRAISLKPDYGEAYQGLAEMVRCTPDDPLSGLVDMQLARDDLDDSTRSYLSFAAGKINDDQGRYAQAFAHYQKGNELAARTFDSEAFRRQVKDSLYLFSRRRQQAITSTGTSEVPIFVVGMPRSGTTLVEQILASHSQVYGAGELNEMKIIARQASERSAVKQPYPHCVSGLSARTSGALANAYLELLARHTGPGQWRRVVDKHPLNFQFIGLIMAMFPRARIVHTVRHPLDTCLSCYFQNFTRGQDYSFDLRSLGHFYLDYLRMMEHWETLFPGRILTVSYEQLLDDQEAETRRLLAYADLAFEPACLRFHETERVVKTASFMQVRQPLYTTSRHRWKHYAEQLRPLAGMLGFKIESPVTILGNHTVLGNR